MDENIDTVVEDIVTPAGKKPVNFSQPFNIRRYEKGVVVYDTGCYRATREGYTSSGSTTHFQLTDEGKIESTRIIAEWERLHGKNNTIPFDTLKAGLTEGTHYVLITEEYRPSPAWVNPKNTFARKVPKK